MKVHFFVTCLFLNSICAFGAEWKSSEGFLTKHEVDELKESIPDIRRGADLEKLIEVIGQQIPTLFVEAVHQNGIWLIKGERAPIITEISTVVLSRHIRKPVSALMQNYIGQVDSPEIRNKILENVNAYLEKRGYPLTKSSIERSIVDKGAQYIVEIDEGEPCIIERIELGFNLPNGVDFNLKNGDICDREEIENAVFNLETDLRELEYTQLKVSFTTIEIDKSNNLGTVYISGSLGQKIRYRITDESQSFSLADIIGEDEASEIDPSIVGPEAMRAELTRRYQNSGYIDVKVEGPEIFQQGTDEFIYEYKVLSGKQYLITDIQFEGLKSFTASEAMEFTGLKSVWKASRPFNKEEVDKGIEALKAEYQRLGYWDVKIRDPGYGQRNFDNATVRLSIQVKEGLPRILRRISVEGAQSIEQSDIRELLNTEPGEPIDRSSLVDYQRDVRTLLVNKGHLYAEVQIDLNAYNATRSIPTEVNVKISEGPRVKIGKISVLGTIKTKEKVVLRELLFEKGDWYDPEKINDTRRALSLLGLFSSVSIKPANRLAINEKAENLDLLIEVREAKPGNVAFGPGWKFLSGAFYESEASYSNLGGIGRTVTLRGAISEEKHQQAIGPKTLIGRSIGIGFKEPYIWDLPITARVSFSHSAKAEDQFWELANKSEFAFGHSLKHLLPTAWIEAFYGYVIKKTEGIREEEENKLADDVVIGSIGARLSYDRRDTPTFPTKGFTVDLEVSKALFELGGNLSYVRTEFDNNYFFGITDQLVYAIGFSVVAYDDIKRKNSDNDVLPFSERLDAGGFDAIRGFRPSKLGPLALVPTFDQDGRWNCGYSNEILRGSRRTLLKQEMRYRFHNEFAVTGFLDSGNVFLTDNQINEFTKVYNRDSYAGNEGCAGQSAKRSVEDNINYKYSELLSHPEYFWERHYVTYGAGLSYLTIIGSVRLAYGLPLLEPKSVKCEEDSQYCFERKKTDSHWLLEGEFHISIDAKF